MMLTDAQQTRTGDWEKVQPISGCWISGQWGHYGLSRMIDIAIEFGCPVTDGDYALLSAYVDGEGYDPDEFYSLADEVEEWMNAWLAPSGYSFGWFEGEYFLMTNQQWLDTVE